MLLILVPHFNFYLKILSVDILRYVNSTDNNRTVGF